MNTEPLTEQIDVAFTDLTRERNRFRFGLSTRPSEITRLEQLLAQLQAEAAETRTVESEVLAKFNARGEEMVPVRYLEPLGAGENLEGQWIVDGENYSKRLNP